MLGWQGRIDEALKDWLEHRPAIIDILKTQKVGYITVVKSALHIKETPKGCTIAEWHTKHPCTYQGMVLILRC